MKYTQCPRCGGNLISHVKESDKGPVREFVCPACRWGDTVPEEKPPPAKK